MFDFSPKFHVPSAVHCAFKRPDIRDMIRWVMYEYILYFTVPIRNKKNVEFRTQSFKQ